MGLILEGDAVAAVPSLALQGSMAVGLLLLGMAQFPIARAMQSSLLGRTPLVPRAFEPIDFLAAVPAFVLAQIAAMLGYCYWVTGTFTPSPEFVESLEALPALGMTAFAQAVPALGIVAVALVRPGGAAQLGIRKVTPGWRAPYALLRYVVALPSLVGLILLSLFLFQSLGMDAPQQDAAVLVKEGLQQNPVAIVLLVAVVVPLLEEILFRGFLLELLVGWIGRRGGVLVSSLAFAALHGAEAFLPIFGLALVLAEVKLRTRSLAAAWLIHAVHNGGTTFLLLAGAELT